MAAKPIEHIEVNLSHITAPRYCLSWVKGEARYHIWIDHESGQVERGLGLGGPTLYKNPPLGVERHQPGWHQARRLDATSSSNAKMVDAAIRQARAAGLFEAAVAAAQAKEDQRVAQAQAELALQRVKDAGPVMLAALYTVKAAAEADGWPAGWGLVAERVTAAIMEAEGNYFDEAASTEENV